jgi:DNA-binding winged helix-turn-helix (wHTH) protein
MLRFEIKHWVGSECAQMTTSESETVNELYEFGPFRVDASRETLLRAGEPVPLTPKTFQILLVLVRHGKEIVTKDDLMKTVWPDTFPSANAPVLLLDHLRRISLREGRGLRWNRFRGLR